MIVLTIKLNKMKEKKGVGTTTGRVIDWVIGLLLLTIGLVAVLADYPDSEKVNIVTVMQLKIAGVLLLIIFGRLFSRGMMNDLDKLFTDRDCELD